MKKIILASLSPRRKELLSAITKDFVVHGSKCEEITSESVPERIVEELAYKKAIDVYENITSKEDSIIIGSDTVVAYNEMVLGKPKDRKSAFEMIKLLQGKEHFVHTGVSLIFTDKNSEITKKDIFHCTTVVEFYPMSDENINEYLLEKDTINNLFYWEGKAGAYGIQDPFGMRYVKKIKGDFYNVVGLPVSEIFNRLK